MCPSPPDTTVQHGAPHEHAVGTHGAPYRRAASPCQQQCHPCPHPRGGHGRTGWKGAARQREPLQRPARWMGFAPGLGMFPASSHRCCPGHLAEPTQGWGTPRSCWGGLTAIPGGVSRTGSATSTGSGSTSGDTAPGTSPSLRCHSPGEGEAPGGRKEPRASSKQTQEGKSPAAVTTICPQQTSADPQRCRPAPQRCRQPPAPRRGVTGMRNFPGGGSLRRR